jgi:hypothetical protein
MFEQEKEGKKENKVKLRPQECGKTRVQKE